MRPEDDLMALASSVKDPPKLWACCGDDDFLIESNRSFIKHITRLNIKHTYIETPGRAHEWGYWDEMIVQAMDWMGL